MNREHSFDHLPKDRWGLWCTSPLNTKGCWMRDSDNSISSWDSRHDAMLAATRGSVGWTYEARMLP